MLNAQLILKLMLKYQKRRNEKEKTDEISQGKIIIKDKRKKINKGN